MRLLPKTFQLTLVFGVKILFCYLLALGPAIDLGSCLYSQLFLSTLYFFQFIISGGQVLRTLVLFLFVYLIGIFTMLFRCLCFVKLVKDFQFWRKNLVVKKSSSGKDLIEYNTLKYEKNTFI